MSRYIGDSNKGQNDDDSSGSEDNNPLGNIDSTLFSDDDDDDITFEPPSKKKVPSRLSKKSKGKVAKPQKKTNRKSSQKTPVASLTETSTFEDQEATNENNEGEEQQEQEERQGAVDLSNSTKKKDKPLTAAQIRRQIKEKKRQHLCELVQANEFLYRKGHVDHSNRDKINNVWVQITQALGETNGKSY